MISNLKQLNVTKTQVTPEQERHQSPPCLMTNTSMKNTRTGRKDKDTLLLHSSLSEEEEDQDVEDILSETEELEKEEEKGKYDEIE